MENDTPKNEDEQDIIPENESDDELTKVKSAYESQKVRAEKAEKEAKELKSQLEKKTPKNTETETPQKEVKSNEPDYGKLAFLNSNKVNNPDDQKLVLDEAKRLNLPLTDVLGMKHIQTQLNDAKDQREAEDGSPKGKGKSGGSNQQDVDYYLAKGTTPEDVELANKVIEARIKKETNANKFSEELYSG